MLYKTQAIVLNTINYNDKYLLASLYTSEFGRVTYMIPKSKSKTGKVQKSMFAPLSILDMEAEHQVKRDIQRIREAHLLYPLHSIQGNMVKTSIVFFLSEFLSRILKDTDEFQIIYNYLSQSIQVLEETEYGLANINKIDSKALSLLSRISFENMHHFVFSRQDRLNIINRMLEYYRIHLHDFQTLKSLDILHELF
ncbi:MAG: recombination protein O N-terminal domain-containing protein [Dysgonomonas sp.]|uniref:DNA repair protein RecO n=1 Tax=Dysgonomonas sp. TaxID=1891233 RepID=UPI00257AA243|nr:recombination protein O N-terminal domain-containing protein [Dysgonomonas sp.]MBS7119782.1 recombination protein O N-terminal domain-containing protein [Dysgonomonas sp.]